MPKDRESKPQSIAKRSTQSSKEKGIEKDELLLLDNILSEGDSYEALKTAESGGAHFQFKFEKSWTQTADAPVNSRFQVQISSMSENFSGIPFSERRDLYLKYCSKLNDADQFSRGNLASVGEFADSSKLFLEDDGEIATLSRKLDELDAAWLAFAQVPVAAENTKTDLIVTQESKNEDVAANKLSRLKVTEENSSRATKPAESNEHNLEDWLDSILDD